MGLEVLHTEDCPNWREAGERAEKALKLLGRGEVTVSYRLLSTPEELARTSFAGSPTLTLDGVDLFPSGGTVTDLACRVYLTPAGVAGLPTQEQIVDALKAVSSR